MKIALFLTLLLSVSWMSAATVHLDRESGYGGPVFVESPLAVRDESPCDFTNSTAILAARLEVQSEPVNFGATLELASKPSAVPSRFFKRARDCI